MPVAKRCKLIVLGTTWEDVGEAIDSYAEYWGFEGLDGLQDYAYLMVSQIGQTGQYHFRRSVGASWMLLKYTFNGSTTFRRLTKQKEEERKQRQMAVAEADADAAEAAAAVAST